MSMEALFGFVGKDYVVIAADSSVISSILTYKDDEDKILAFSKTKMFGSSGPVGDRKQLSDYLVGNFNLHKVRTNKEIDMEATASSFRNSVAYFIRNHPYEVNLILGGLDDSIPSLYYLDYLGTLQRVNYSSHGYVAYFLMSIFDRFWHEDMTLEEGYDLLNKITTEIKSRFLVNLPHYTVKILTKEGIQVQHI
ncbi:hypothetical protein WA158_001291 [Blastocystis sp. Blastoise]